MRADSQDLRRALARLAEEQAGYFTAAQALEVGYSYQSQHYHARRGNWQRVGRGIFRIFEWPHGEHDEYALWSLWAGDEAAISHQTALEVHRIGEFNPARVHLTVPPGFRRTAKGVTVHHATLRPDEIEQRTGFNVTTLTRTLIDVAASGVDGDQLQRAIAEAFDARLVTPRQLRDSAEEADQRSALHIERALGRLDL